MEQPSVAVIGNPTTRLSRSQIPTVCSASTIDCKGLTPRNALLGTIEFKERLLKYHHLRSLTQMPHIPHEWNG
jgi:hypothetical protein